MIADAISIIPLSHQEKVTEVFFFTFFFFVDVIDMFANMIYELHDLSWEFFADGKKVELERLLIYALIYHSII